MQGAQEETRVTLALLRWKETEYYALLV